MNAVTAFVAVLAVASVEAYPPVSKPHGKWDWTTPFKLGSCDNCPDAHGVVLPWCIRLNAASLKCAYGQPNSPLPECLTVSVDQIEGQIPATMISGQLVNGQIASGITADKLTCEGSEEISLSCITGVTVDDASFANLNVLPSNVAVTSENLCGSGDITISCLTLDPDQVTGLTDLIDAQIEAATATIDATTLTCPSNSSSKVTLSCVALSNTTLTNVVIDSTSTFNGTVNVNNATCNSFRNNCFQYATPGTPDAAGYANITCPTGKLAPFCPEVIGTNGTDATCTLASVIQTMVGAGISTCVYNSTSAFSTTGCNSTYTTGSQILCL